MEEEEFAPYKDISELKKELEGMKPRRDVSTKELYDVVSKLADTISGMLEVFGAAADQMRLEEKGYEAEFRKHEMIISKLDKILDQNKTIAEGMVAVVEMVKQKIVAPAKEREDSMFKPKEKEETIFRQSQAPAFAKPVQQEWQPKPEPMMPRQPVMMPRSMQPQMSMPQMPPQMSQQDFGMDLPPLEPTPDLDASSLDLPDDFPELGDEPKKKGLFGMFKK